MSSHFTYLLSGLNKTALQQQTKTVMDSWKLLHYKVMSDIPVLQYQNILGDSIFVYTHIIMSCILILGASCLSRWRRTSRCMGGWMPFMLR